ncbi:hypothetical protein DPMN_075622 [Dreissena polymorpha]|uniref:Uncharacterized protein n=1 Tax=Dreissena polymorpha TaxID=45954 RepID=A0A9D3YJY0_DREPO|nr:hypothetical protein DPMN_075622 [Dreissena polymorpha]
MVSLIVKLPFKTKREIKHVTVLDINQERTGNLVNVTAFVFGPGANTVETNWEIDGTKISSHQKNVSENETIISVIVNGTIGELQLVHRLGVSELGRENVLLKEKQGPEDATQLGAGAIVGIVLGILVVIVPVIFFIVYSQRKKQYCFRKTAQTNESQSEPLHDFVAASTENGKVLTTK